MSLAKSSMVRLASGAEMPILGLGVWKMEDGAETETAVAEALKAGYRHIDTAKLYGNEASVGRAVRESGIPRSEIFVTTKLWPTDFLSPEAAFDASLERLGLEYVDLYLIHWPIPLMPKSVWQALERIHERGTARSIGVSNYSRSDIESLLSYARVQPAVNQVRFSPFDYDAELLGFCRERKIALEAYSPLTRGTRLNDAAIAEIAARHRKSPAQIMIRWCIDHDVVVIPKSSNPARIRENIDVFDFELSEADMAVLDALS